VKKQFIFPLVLLLAFPLLSCEGNTSSGTSTLSPTGEDTSLTDTSLSSEDSTSKENHATDLTVSLFDQLPTKAIDDKNVYLLYAQHSFALGLAIVPTDADEKDIEVTFPRDVTQNTIAYQNGQLVTGNQAKETPFEIAISIKGTDIKKTYTILVASVENYVLMRLENKFSVTEEAEAKVATKATLDHYAYNGKNFYSMAKEEVNYYLNEVTQNTSSSIAIRKVTDDAFYSVSLNSNGGIETYKKEIFEEGFTKESVQNSVNYFLFHDYEGGDNDTEIYGLVNTIKEKILTSDSFLGGSAYKANWEIMEDTPSAFSLVASDSSSNQGNRSLSLNFDAQDRITELTYLNSESNKLVITMEYGEGKTSGEDSFVPSSYYFDSYEATLVSKKTDSYGDEETVEVTKENDTYVLDMQKEYFLNINSFAPAQASILVDPIEIEKITDESTSGVLTPVKDDNGKITSIKATNAGTCKIVLKATAKIASKEILVKVKTDFIPMVSIAITYPKELANNSEEKPLEIKQGETKTFKVTVLGADNKKHKYTLTASEEDKKYCTLTTAPSAFGTSKVKLTEDAPIDRIIKVTISSEGLDINGEHLVTYLYVKVVAAA